MIDISALQARIIDGLHPYVAPYGVTAIIERDQDAPKPPYPFIGLRGLSALLGRYAVVKLRRGRGASFAGGRCPGYGSAGASGGRGWPRAKNIMA